MNNDIDCQRLRDKDFTAIWDWCSIDSHGVYVLNDFVIVTLLFKCQGMSDEWGTIDQSDVGIHIVVEISWGTGDKELPKECRSMQPLPLLLGLCQDPWKVQAVLQLDVEVQCCSRCSS